MRRLAALLLFAALLPAAASAGAPPAAQARDPAWSPDGTRLAYVRTEGATGRIVVVGFRGGTPLRVTPRFRGPYGLSWSPDGRSLAFASGGDIWRLDVASGSFTRLTNRSELDAFHPTWSPDGTTIAYAVFEGCFRCTRIYAVDSAGGQRPRLLADGPRRPEWGRLGEPLLTSYPVALVDVPAGTVMRVASGSFASWSVDRSEFSFFGLEGSPGVYVSTSSRIAPQLVVPSRRVLAFPVISPGHLRIAFVRSGRVVLFRRYLHAERVLARSDSADDAPAWSFRGQLAFVADGPCGRRSEIDVVRADGSRQHALVRTCS